MAFDPATDPDLGPRFREVALLGRGAFGAVYRAVDDADREVAVKVLDAGASPEARWLFHQEFRRLARLAHPAFPRAYEAGSTESGRLFFSMERLGGSPLAGPISPERVREVLAAFATALAALHGAGYVHGDLKLENARWEAGRLRLLDVGLAAPVGQKREAIAGTLEYMAPEVLRKAPVEPRADLYALGVLAYALLTGRLPFTGEPAALVRAQLTAPPPPLETADAALARLIEGLLAKDPAERVGSAQAVSRALGHEVDLPAVPGLFAGRWVGREALAEAWDDALARHGRLRFGGPLGAGKSRALDELKLRAELAGHAWVGATAAGAGPAGPVRQVVASALALAGLAPSLHTASWLSGEVAGELLELEPAARQSLFFAAAAADLARAAEAVGALAVGLDDWHAADGASVAFLDLLARRDVPVAFAIAEEPGDAPDGFFTLAPLSRAATAELLESRLGRPAEPAFAERLFALSGGSPLIVDLALEHMAASGALQAGPDGWTVVAGAVGLPEGLSGMLAARFAHLPQEAQTLAAACAVAVDAGDLPAAWLGEAAGVDDVGGAVESLVAEGVVLAVAGRLRLAMPAVREAFWAGVDERERARWASRLARRMMEREDDLDGLVRAATLALAGDDDALAVELAGEAGRRALAMAAPGTAIALLDGAAARLARADEATQLSVVLPRAEAARQLDRLEAAAADYEAASRLAESLGDRSARARALIGLGKCRQLAGRYAEAQEALEAAAGLAGPALAARAQLALARVHLFGGALPRAVEAAERAVALAREAEARVLLAQALNLHALLLLQGDMLEAERALAPLRESLALSEALGDRIGAGQALDNLGNAHLAVGDLAGAAEAFRRAAETAREAGAETEAMSAGVNLALARSELGELAEAEALAAEVAARARRIGRKFPLGVALTALGQAAWRAGRAPEALGPLEEALALATGIGNRLLEEHVRMYRLEAFLALGEREAAAAEAEATAAIVEATGHAEMQGRLACARAELARQGGDEAGARALASPWLESPNRLIAHHAHRALGAFDGAHAERALAIAEGWPSAWHAAWDRVLVARTMAPAAPDAALALARRVLAPGPNPYARLAAAQCLAEWAEGQEAAEARAQASELQGAWRDLAPDRRQALYAVYGLSEVAEARVPVRTGIDPMLYAAAMEMLASAEDEAALGEAALDGAMALVGAERGYLLSYEAGRLNQAVTRRLDSAEALEDGFSRSIAEQVLFSGEPVYAANAAADARWQESASVMALALKTVVGLPLAVPSRLLGVLYMDREAIEPILSEGDLQLLHAFATAAASAMLRERGRREAKAVAARREACAALGARLARGAGADRVRREVLGAALALTGAERAFWLAPSSEGWRVELALGEGGRALGLGGEAVSRGIADWVAERQEPMSLLDVGEAEGWQERASVMALGLKTVWCLPAGTGLVYLDATSVVEGDPQSSLAAVAALVAYAEGLS